MGRQRQTNHQEWVACNLVSVHMINDTCNSDVVVAPCEWAFTSYNAGTYSGFSLQVNQFPTAIKCIFLGTIKILILKVRIIEGIYPLSQHVYFNKYFIDLPT